MSYVLVVVLWVTPPEADYSQASRYTVAEYHSYADCARAAVNIKQRLHPTVAERSQVLCLSDATRS